MNRVHDLSRLPTYAFGHHSPMWWGTAGFMLIEGVVFVLAIFAYFYLRTEVADWPPSPAADPDLLWGSVNTGLMLLSAVPMAKNAAYALDQRRARLWLGVALAIGLAFLVLRVFEFGGLNVRWNDNAYGSIVWALLGLHTTHLLTDWLDSAVLEVVLFLPDMEEKRFVDVAENAVYWYFVVLAWLPIYAVIYWAPRWL